MTKRRDFIHRDIHGRDIEVGDRFIKRIQKRWNGGGLSMTDGVVSSLRVRQVYVRYDGVDYVRFAEHRIWGANIEIVRTRHGTPVTPQDIRQQAQLIPDGSGLWLVVLRFSPHEPPIQHLLRESTVPDALSVIKERADTVLQDNDFLLDGPWEDQPDGRGIRRSVIGNRP